MGPKGDYAGNCDEFSTCPGRQDGAGLPLLPFLWGGLAADRGVYRTLPASDFWVAYDAQHPSLPPAPEPLWKGGEYGPSWTPGWGTQ